MILVALPLALLVGQNSQASSQTHPANHAKDVIVTGLRPGTAEETKGIKTPHDRHSFARRSTFEKAAMFASCVHNVPAAEMRKIIDGPPNRADTRAAQGLLIAHHAGCYWNLQPPPLPPLPADPKDFGDSPYDRGALLEQVFAQYAPDAELTRKETGDPAVQRRFDAREVPRNRWRLAADYRIFAIAVCLIRMEPEATVELLHAEPGSPRENSIERTIVGRARVCVGDAREVRFDSLQLRFFMIDALYRWIVAARGVETLITDDPMNPH